MDDTSGRGLVGPEEVFSNLNDFMYILYYDR